MQAAVKYLVHAEIVDPDIRLGHQFVAPPLLSVDARERCEIVTQSAAAKGKAARKAIIQHQEFNNAARLDPARIQPAICACSGR